MHPPFFTTDYRSVVHTPHPVSHRTGLRRTTPVVLPVTLSHLIENPFIPAYLVEDVHPDEIHDTRPVRLTIVPAPVHSSLRDVVGRWLIRLGQRLILTNHPG